MKICKVCNEEAKYPHYVSSDGSITCVKCSMQNEIERSIPNIVGNIKKVKSWDELYLISEISELLSTLETRDIEAINYILKSIKDRS